MQDYPHHYHVHAEAQPEGSVNLASEKLPPLASAPPLEFGGPGDQWSPETLLVASVADCFILSFRAIARASKFEWKSLSCEVVGTLERIEKKNQIYRIQRSRKTVDCAGNERRSGPAPAAKSGRSLPDHQLIIGFSASHRRGQRVILMHRPALTMRW